MNRFASKRTQTGAVFQAGIPFIEPTDGYSASILVRAIVMRTLVYDDPQHPFKQRPTAVFCDCLCYTQLSGGRYYPLYKVVVSQDKGGVQKGHIWYPRASRNAQLLEKYDSPTPPPGSPDISQLDGDHVLIGFIDDRRHLPVILRGMPHPMADRGNQDAPLGKRMRMRVIDGSYDMSKHNGVYNGVDANGNHFINTVSGNTGDLTSTLTEVAGVPGVSGNQVNTAPAGATIQHTIADPASGTALAAQVLQKDALNVTFSGSPGAVNIVNSAGPLVGVTIGATGKGNVVLGNGTVQAVDNQKLVDFINNQIIAIFAGHTHPVTGTANVGGVTGTCVGTAGTAVGTMGPALATSFPNNSVKVPTS